MASAVDGPGCVNSRLALGVLTPAGVGIEDRGMEHPPKSNEAADTVLAWFGLALSVMLLIVGIDMNRDGEWSVLVLGALMVVVSLYQLLRDFAVRRDQRRRDKL